MNPLKLRLLAHDTFMVMYKAYDQIGDDYRAKAYYNAAKSLANNESVTSGMQEKIKLIEKGQFPYLEKLKELIMLINIPGFGKAKILQYINEHKTINDIKNLPNLTKYQKIGLKYYKKINKELTRETVDDVFSYIPIKKDIIVTGSYRRGKQLLGDIDMLCTIDNYSLVHQYQNIVKNKINVKNHIEYLDTLMEGDKKFTFLIKYYNKLRSSNIKKHKTILYDDNELYDYYIIQIDIRFCTKEEYPSMVLYFTGSKEFNIMCRRIAKQKGYILNEYGLYSANDIKNRIELNSEIEIIDYLGLDKKYYDPYNRNIDYPMS